MKNVIILISFASMVLSCFGCAKCKECKTKGEIKTEIIRNNANQITRESFETIQERCGKGNIKEMENSAGSQEIRTFVNGEEAVITTTTVVVCD